MECYTLELVHECADPMMRAVPCAYILTLSATETFPWLHGVAARTYVQRNRGFRACPKTRADGAPVGATNQDLMHAYQSVFSRAGSSALVLVFEDDAQLTATAREDLAVVDRFVATSAFHVYTLGSKGAMLPHDGTHWRMPTHIGATHAVIYSPDAARVVAASRIGDHDHIDWHVLGPMPLKFTFHRPIAWQKWDWRNRSENSRTWCSDCGPLADIHREADWLYYRALGMHAELGWSRMYVIQKYKPWIVITLTPLLALLAAFLAFRAFRAFRSRNARPVS
jgi:hypothetical protein